MLTDEGCERNRNMTAWKTSYGLRPFTSNYGYFVAELIVKYSKAHYIDTESKTN